MSLLLDMWLLGKQWLTSAAIHVVIYTWLSALLGTDGAI